MDKKPRKKHRTDGVPLFGRTAFAAGDSFLIPPSDDSLVLPSIALLNPDTSPPTKIFHGI